MVSADRRDSQTYSSRVMTREASQATIQALIGGTDLVPDWEHSLYSENSVESYLEFPLITESRLGVGPSGAANDSEIRLTQRRLVVRETKASGELYLYTSLWIPDDPYSEAIMPGLTMFSKGDFSGQILFFHLDGQFYWGSGFEAGLPVASVSLSESMGTRIEIPCTVTITEWFSMVCSQTSNGTLYDCNDPVLISTSSLFSCERALVWIDLLDGGGGGPSNDPINPDDGLSGGSAGGGGSTPPPPAPANESTDPCANMNNKMANTEFTDVLDVLADYTGDNREYGMAYRYSNGSYNSWQLEEGPIGDPVLYYSPSADNKIDGYFHTHYDGTLPVFSVSDLLIPGAWNANGGINDMSRFTIGVVTPSGTYFLQITDPQAYQNFYNMYSQNQMTVDILEGWYEDTYNIKTTTSTTNAVNGLARMLNAANSGMTLMKKSGDGFNRISVGSNNNVTENPC